eukprot:COSAG02_NODE_241_length_27638_cov_13.101020_10_plen_134_part_00
MGARAILRGRCTNPYRPSWRRCIGYTWRPHSDRTATDLDGNGIIDPDEYSDHDHSLCSIKGAGMGKNACKRLVQEDSGSATAHRLRVLTSQSPIQAGSIIAGASRPVGVGIRCQEAGKSKSSAAERAIRCLYS